MVPLLEVIHHAIEMAEVKDTVKQRLSLFNAHQIIHCEVRENIPEYPIMLDDHDEKY